MTLALKEQRVSTGEIRELLSLFLPILVMTFSNYIFLLLEKVFLARLSVEAMEAAVNATYGCMISHISCTALAAMAQVYVGRWIGAKEFTTIGPGLWQFLWFSLLSMLFTFPLSMLYGKFYFFNSHLKEIALPYFYFLSGINFLYPLATSLICFYVAQGKTRLILFSSLSFQILKTLLAYLLIFGWKDYIPAFGIMGGAISIAITQSGFCLLLLYVFLKPEYARLYNTRQWHFRKTLFWECVHPGLLRAFSRILVALCWASIAKLMSARGETHLLILSIGGSIFLFLPSLADAICQAQLTVLSHILGQRNYEALSKAFRSCSFLVLLTVILAAVPLILFPMVTFNFLFPSIEMNSSTISTVFFGIWVSFAFYTYGYVPISSVLAFKDTKFSLFMGGVIWINGFLLMYLAIEHFNIPPDYFWLVLSLMHGSTTLLYLWRMKWLESRLTLSPKAAFGAIQNREFALATAKLNA